jgi:hypothetical protein
MNHDFYPNSPVWNYLLGVSWWLGGFWGLFVFGFLAIFGFFAVTYVLARKLGAHPLGAAAGIVGGFIWAMPMVSSRGTVGVQILLTLGLLVTGWWRPRLERYSPLLNGLAFLAIGATLGTVGNWIHLSFLLMGPALAVCWGVYWLAADWPGSWRSRLTDRRRWALVLGGAAGLVIGSLTTPYGVAGTIERSRETAAACATYIIEWVSPFDPGLFGTGSLAVQWRGAALIGLTSAVLVVLWWIRRMRRGCVDNRFALVCSIATLAVPLSIAGMFALRFLGLSILMMMPVWGAAITWAAHRLKHRAVALASDHRFKETAMRWTQTVPWRRVLMIVWALLLPLAVWLSVGIHARPSEMDAIDSLPRGCRLFSTALVAGPVILARPDILVWFDGRADYYGQERLAENYAYITGQAATAAPPGATCAVFPALTHANKLPRLTARMNADPQWRLVATIDEFDVWLRQP